MSDTPKCPDCGNADCEQDIYTGACLRSRSPAPAGLDKVTCREHSRQECPDCAEAIAEEQAHEEGQDAGRKAIRQVAADEALWEHTHAAIRTAIPIIRAERDKRTLAIIREYQASILAREEEHRALLAAAVAEARREEREKYPTHGGEIFYVPVSRAVLDRMKSSPSNPVTLAVEVLGDGKVQFVCMEHRCAELFAAKYAPLVAAVREWQEARWDWAVHGGEARRARLEAATAALAALPLPPEVP